MIFPPFILLGAFQALYIVFHCGKQTIYIGHSMQSNISSALNARFKIPHNIFMIRNVLWRTGLHAHYEYTFTRKVRYHFSMGLSSSARLITSELVFVKVYAEEWRNMFFNSLNHKCMIINRNRPPCRNRMRPESAQRAKCIFSVYSVAS